MVKLWFKVQKRQLKVVYVSHVIAIKHKKDGRRYHRESGFNARVPKA